MTSPHVAVVAFPFSSHGSKLLALARALAAAEPSATFSFLSSHDSIVRLRGTATAVTANMNLVEVPSAEWDKGTSVARQIELFLDAAEDGGLRQALDMAASMAGGARVSCVVGDAFMSMAAEAVVPRVAVWTGGPLALLAHIMGDAIRKDIDNEAARRRDEFLTAYPGLGSFRVRDLPFGDPATGGKIHNIMMLLLQRVAERLPRATLATALNFFTGLFPPDVSAALANTIPNSLPIGPYHMIPGAVAPAADDPLGCLPWLSRHPEGSVVYISFG